MVFFWPGMGGDSLSSSFEASLFGLGMQRGVAESLRYLLGAFLTSWTDHIGGTHSKCIFGSAHIDGGVWHGCQGAGVFLLQVDPTKCRCFLDLLAAAMNVLQKES